MSQDKKFGDKMSQDKMFTRYKVQGYNVSRIKSNKIKYLKDKMSWDK